MVENAPLPDERRLGRADRPAHGYLEDTQVIRGFVVTSFTQMRSWDGHGEAGIGLGKTTSTLDAF